MAFGSKPKNVMLKNPYNEIRMLSDKAPHFQLTETNVPGRKIIDAYATYLAISFPSSLLSFSKSPN